jgi:hypothetical protein
MTDIAPALPGTPTAGAQPPHVLVVTEFEDKLWFKIECPGVTDACRAWAECHDDRCDHDVLDKAMDDGDDEPELHGVRHRYIGDAHVGWGVPTNDCWPSTVGGVYDAAQEIRTDWAPGRYPVEHGVDAEYDEYLTLHLLDTTEGS